jgi:hypothetical protein
MSWKKQKKKRRTGQRKPGQIPNDYGRCGLFSAWLPGFLSLYLRAVLWDALWVMPRTIPVCLLFLALAALSVRAQAQVQDQEIHVAKLLQTRNTYTAMALFQNKSFFTGNGDYAKGYNGINSFNFVTRFRLNDYQTKAFNSSGYWDGNFKFDSKQAYLGNNHGANPDGTKLFATKPAETKTATEQGEKYGTKTYGTQPYLQRGTAQTRIDQQGTKVFEGSNPLGTDGSMHTLTIDEVRTMLNKPK